MGTSSVRGAIKGILVTSCDQDLASYEFIKGKPLSLLDSSDLLHLLKQPGHKASIDIAAPNNRCGMDETSYELYLFERLTISWKPARPALLFLSIIELASCKPSNFKIKDNRWSNINFKNQFPQVF